MTHHLSQRAIALLLPATAALAACVSVPPPPTGDQWASLGETAQAGPMLIRPEHVLEDSRCPMNARCIQAGRVQITATLWIDGKAHSAKLLSDEPFAIAGGMLVIDAIKPESFMTSDHPQPDDYEFHFDFQPDE